MPFVNRALICASRHRSHGIVTTFDRCSDIGHKRTAEFGLLLNLLKTLAVKRADMQSSSIAVGLA